MTSSVDINEISELNFKKIKNCCSNFMNEVKNIISFLFEYDLYNGTKWDDY